MSGEGHKEIDKENDRRGIMGIEHNLLSLAVRDHGGDRC